MPGGFVQRALMFGHEVVEERVEQHHRTFLPSSASCL
jgi:hypothetical protein